MNRYLKAIIAVLIMSCAISIFVYSKDDSANPERYISPCALAFSRDGTKLYIGGGTDGILRVLNTKTHKLEQSIKISSDITGLALFTNGDQLYVTSTNPEGVVKIVNTRNGEITDTISAGNGATSPVLSADGKSIYVCNRFDNDISVINLASKSLIARIKVSREPIASALDITGNRLIVANHLPDGPADIDHIASAINVIDLDEKKVVSRIDLPNGSTGVRGICISPDGLYAYVTHTLGRYQVPTSQIQRGWMNTNAFSIIDLQKTKLLNTVLLDELDRGVANPWAVACSGDGKRIIVSIAGTNELCIIDSSALISKLLSLPLNSDSGEITSGDVPDTLTFLDGIRIRIPLTGIGPRVLAVRGNTVYAAEYFTDTLSVIDDISKAPKARSVALGQTKPMTAARRGEMLFNNGYSCFQSWQTCASCHPDGRADSLNWDLLNDGMGNPKNTKSLLLSHMTPPVMVTGIRKDAETAVRSGMKFIQFMQRPDDEAKAMDEYLKSMKPIPSPYLLKGKISESAQRGKAVFEKAECASCHPAPLYTDMKKYNVGTGKYYEAGKKYDTPTLEEIWRTSPYLYDGRAASMKDVLTIHNKSDKHGKTTGLKDSEMNELVNYILSL
ncbi:MAG: c-type cytochrome [Armatimonadota bacterium]